MKQLAIDFTPQPIMTGKKTERLAVPCSPEFIQFLDMLARLHNRTRAELAFDFILEGMQRALGNAFMAEPFLEKQLSELMSK